MNKLVKNLALAALAGLLSAVAIVVAVFLFTDGVDLSTIDAEGAGKIIGSMLALPAIFMALAAGLWVTKRMEASESKSPLKSIFGLGVGILIVAASGFIVASPDKESTRPNDETPSAKPGEIIGFGVTTAAAQSPSKEVTTRFLDNVETLAFCYAHHAASGNILKSSGQKAQSIAAYNTAFVFQFLATSTMIAGVQRKGFSVEQFTPVLQTVKGQYPSLTDEDKEQFKELCPNAHKVFFGSLNDNLKNFVATHAKKQAEIYYNTKPTSVDGMIEDVKGELAKEKK